MLPNETEHLSSGIINDRNAYMVTAGQNLCKNGSALVEGKLGQQPSLVHENVEYQIVNFCLGGTKVLKQVEVGFTGGVESDDFTIQYGSGLQTFKRFRDVTESIV